MDLEQTKTVGLVGNAACPRAPFILSFLVGGLNNLEVCSSVYRLSVKVSTSFERVGRGTMDVTDAKELDEAASNQVLKERDLPHAGFRA